MLVSSDLERRASVIGQDLALGALAVVGAGLSLSSRFPLTKGLTTLLWDSLDADSAARADLAVKLGRSDASSKKLVGDEWPDVRAAWASVASSPVARARFQAQFATLDDERSRQPSPAHEGLARLVHAGVVERVISLNWDTALEKAYSRLYGTLLPDGLLLKPHGDAARPDLPWVLPHEEGFIPTGVAEQVNLLIGEHARTLLIIGYSERDRVVVDELLKPLDRSWRTVRIGPSASGPDDLPAPAETAMPLLADPFAAREGRSAWHTVTYSGRRGLQAALVGERLGPMDVEACPELDEVRLLEDALRADRAVVLNGPTGSGKSITGYQALYRLAGEGFEVLRLRDDARGRSMASWLTDLALFPHRKVLLVDDAQDLSPDTVRELAERATHDMLVLVVGIDHVAGGVRTVRLGATAAVARLARYAREQREAVFPLVHALDDQVGDHANDLWFDRRVDAAEREQTSWQFFYTLTGGWRRVRRAALELRDHDRADIALLAVAVAQIASVDAGATRGGLKPMLSALRRDEAWLEASLDVLLQRRMVSESDGALRCTHLRAAYNMVTWMLHPSSVSYTPPAPRPPVPPIASADVPVLPIVQSAATPPPAPTMDLARSEVEGDRAAVGDLISLVLDSEDAPLRGCAWLSGRNIGGDTRLWLKHLGVLTPERYERLARRALATPANGDVTAAAQLLADVIAYSDGSVIDVVRSNANRLAEWFGGINPANGWALGDLVNSLHRPDEEFAAAVAAYAEPSRLGRLILDGGWPHIYSTCQALDRIVNVGGMGVAASLRPNLDEEALEHMLFHGRPELWQSARLIEAVAYADHDLSLRLFSRFAPRLAQQFIVHPLRMWNDLFTLVMHVLGYGPHFLRPRSRPPEKCVKAARAFIRALDRGRVAACLSGPQEDWGQMNFDTFVNFLEEADPETFTAVIREVDLASFESSLSAGAAGPSRTGLYVLASFQKRRPDETHAVLDRLEPGLDRLDPLFAYMAPDLTCRALRRGLPLDLELDQHHWGWAAEVILRLCDEDPVIAREVAQANSQAMARGLLIANHSDPFEGLASWVTACDTAAPELVDEVLSGLPEGAIAEWAKVIRRPPNRHPWRRNEVTPLLQRAARAGGHVESEAKGLLARFPSLKKARSVPS